MSKTDKEDILQAIAGIGIKVDRLDDRVKALELSFAEMRGEMRGLSSWLQSMDQRFTAIMRPYEPPKTGTK